MVIFHKNEPRDLEAAYRKYCNREIENAHCAEEDARASAEVLEGQLEYYRDLPRDVAGLSSLCDQDSSNYVDYEGKFVWVDGEAVFNFSKDHRGRRLDSVAKEDPGFLTWMIGRDFSPEVEEIVSKALRGEFPKSSSE